MLDRQVLSVAPYSVLLRVSLPPVTLNGGRSSFSHPAPLVPLMLLQMNKYKVSTGENCPTKPLYVRYNGYYWISKPVCVLRLE